MGTQTLRLKVGYELVYRCPQPVPMILVVNVHHSRVADLLVPDPLVTEPFTERTSYHDSFGNLCYRLIAPAGSLKIRGEGIVQDTGRSDEIVPDALQHSVEDLPDETLTFLLGSRYCETDLLSETAWQLFSDTPAGWPRVQAICDYVHNRIGFNYQKARATRTAAQAYEERTGVCRDFTHLAVAFCRCMNIPARYCTGYLSDIGTPTPWGIGDFAAWFEVYLEGRWHTFDARNNEPRTGRVLMARGRDAADVAIVTTFGPNLLESFSVWADEVIGAQA